MDVVQKIHRKSVTSKSEQKHRSQTDNPTFLTNMRALITRIKYLQHFYEKVGANK